MKTPTQIKFDQIIENGFHDILKPLGFKKKSYNFYLKNLDLGQIINIQKSSFYSKDQIRFTINTGIFVPEYWIGLFYNSGKEIPIFPTEPECLIRQRIGKLRNQNDTWYEVDETTDEKELIIEMKINLENYILPYFEQTKTKEGFLEMLDKNKLPLAPLGKLVLYWELKQISKAKSEYNKLLNESSNIHFKQTVKDYGIKYGLDNAI